jgi:hypothetical protein
VGGKYEVVAGGANDPLFVVGHAPAGAFGFHQLPIGLNELVDELL